MSIPVAPQEGGGDKILFTVYDNSGANASALLRGAKKTTLNSEPVADLQVYPTSGTLENGSKVLGGSTATVISTSVACQGVLVKAYSDNIATIYVGKSDVTADKTAATGGWPLEPGESVGVPCRNVTEVYIRGTSGDGVAWLASCD